MTTLVNFALYMTAANLIVVGMPFLFYVAYIWIKSMLNQATADPKWVLSDIKI